MWWERSRADDDDLSGQDEDLWRSRGSIPAVRPGSLRKRRMRPTFTSQHVAPPPGHADRLARDAARVAAEDPGTEPVHCWGPCGRVLSNAKKCRPRGWHVRDVVCGPTVQREVQCPDCFAAWGWIEPPTTGGA